jgi:DNA-binding winged helix-turn-helix (wHTH) protein
VSHIMRLVFSPSGPGIIFLLSAGNAPQSREEHKMTDNFTNHLAMRETTIDGSGSTMPSERLASADAPVLERFNSDSSFGVRRRVQSSDADQLEASKPAGATPREISFGPFRLLPAQFLLLQGDKPVPLGSRAMQILIVLLERPGELITKQELMARVWPNLFVEPANLAVHISALRRALGDGRDGNRFIINIPGRGYCFVTPIRLMPCKRPAGAHSLFRPIGDVDSSLVPDL